MGTLFSTLDIARSGMQVAQVQLDVAGHNIANVNKEGFSRQRAELVTRSPIFRSYGQLGRGVGIDQIARVRNTVLDGLFRDQVAGMEDAELRADFYARVEDIFLEPGASGLSGRLNLFFDSLQQFSTNVESLAARQSVITEADSLSTLFNETASRLNTLRTNANDEIINFVPEINSLASSIAQLNAKITLLEVGGNPANDLRDDRDLLLDELSGIVDIFTRERSSGAVDVLIGDQELVRGDLSRELETVINAALDPVRSDFVEIRFVDNGRLLNNADGALFGAFELRDRILVDVETDVNLLAATIIQEINNVHSQGSGLVGLTTVNGTNGVTDPTLALNAAGLPYTVNAGSFDINVFDAAGVPTGGSPTTIAIGPGTTLNDVVAAINAIPELTATIAFTGELQITTAAGFSFGFSNDSSDVLSALGMNTLFSGTDAASMGVNTLLANEPRLLASRFSTNPLDLGDNSAALALAGVQNGLFMLSNSATINEFYESMVVEIGIDARANIATLEVEQTFVESFQRRRQEVSGVSIDEEVTFLMQFQRAFEASARVVTVTDRMLDSLLAMAL